MVGGKECEARHLRQLLPGRDAPTCALAHRDPDVIKYIRERA
jgi:hypothetical protein